MGIGVDRPRSVGIGAPQDLGGFRVIREIRGSYLRVIREIRGSNLRVIRVIRGSNLRVIRVIRGSKYQISVHLRLS